MKRSAWLSYLLCAVLLLGACAKKPAPAASPQAPASSAAPAVSSESAPAQQPEPVSESAPQEPEGNAAAGGLMEDGDVRRILEWVPKLGDYLKEGKLRIREEDFGDEVFAQGQRCRIVSMEGEGGVRRSFACGVEEPFLFEFDETACEWYQRFPAFTGVSDAEAAAYLQRHGFLAGFAYIGAPSTVPVDPSDPARGFSLLPNDRISTLAREGYPWIDEIDASHTIEGQGPEHYLVIFADPTASVSVNRIENGEVAEVLYRSDAGEPIIVTADSEEPRIEITVVDRDGKILTFSPIRWDGMFDFLYDAEHGESPTKFGFAENLPMGGNTQTILDAIVLREPDLTENGYEPWVDPDETVEIACRPCWIVELGHWYGNEYHIYERRAVSDDCRHVYLETNGGWEEYFGETLLRVTWEADSPFERGEYDDVAAGVGGDPQAELAIWARGEVRDFQFLALTLEGVDEEGKPRFSERVLDSRTLHAGRPILVQTAFFGDIPNNGIAYTDENGRTRRFALSVSGKDGALELTEYGSADAESGKGGAAG